MRGFAAVGLDNPKSEVNVGSAMRAVGVYGAAMLAISGRRLRSGCTDTMKHHKHIPLIHADDIFQLIPHDCVPVAVDLVEGQGHLLIMYTLNVRFIFLVQRMQL